MSSKKETYRDAGKRPLVSDNGRFVSLMRKVIIVIVWIALWEILSLAVHNEFMLASPIDSLCALISLAQTAEFWIAILYSFLRIAAGFFLGFFAGFVLGMLAARYRTCQEFLDVGMGLMKSIPLACIVVLVLIWFGAKGVTILAVFFVVAPSLYFATKAGFGNLDEKMIQMLAVFNVSKVRSFFVYDLPHALSHIASACRLVLGMSWKAGVAAELIGIVANTIGERIYQTKLLLMTSDLFAWTFVIVVLAALSERLFMAGLMHFVTWLQKTAALKFGNHVQEQESDFCETIAEGGMPQGLVLNEVEVSYGEREVIPPVSAQIKAGGTLMVVGPSGQGKTTLLTLLMGLPLGTDAQRRGEVVFSHGEGEKTYDAKENAESAEGGLPATQIDSHATLPAVSTVFQDQRLIEELTPLENVMLVCGKQFTQARVSALLAELLEEESLARACKTLSGGQRRRVELVRALAHPSNVVILDEPFSSLDRATAAKALCFMQEHRCGRTLILSAHDSAQAETLGATVLEI